MVSKIDLESSSYEQVAERITTLNGGALSLHKTLIQLAFHSRVTEIAKVETGLTTNYTYSELESSDQVLTQEQLVKQAIAIATEIESKAIRSSNGETISWIGLSYTSNTERLQLRPLGYHYYDGNGGIALFFAALFKVTEINLYRDLALSCVRSLRDVLTADSQSQAKFAKGIGIGGAVGIGCLVHSLTKVGQFLNLPELIQEAKQFSQLLTPELIASDRKFDIVEGAAGAILGLLALYQQTKDSNVLQKASDCGEHLLDYCDRAYSGGKYNFEPDPMTGFGHGASGLGYALLRLYEVTKDQDFLTGAQEAIAYENSFYVPSVGNWREFISRGATSTVFWSTWCHGAVGIGLGLLGGYRIHHNPLLLSRIRVALTATQKNSLNIDHLCCGNFGRVETLLVGARELSDSHYYDAALNLATRVVKRAQHKGSYELFGNLPTPVFNPSFFKGLSGVGYQLLRLAEPELPSLLLWE